MNSLSIILTSVVSASIGQLTFKIGMNKIGIIDRIDISSLLKIVTNSYILLGCVLYLLGLLLWLVALSKMNLNFVYPFTSLTFILVLFFSQFILREQLSRNIIIGYILIIFGIVFISTGSRIDQ